MAAVTFEYDSREVAVFTDRKIDKALKRALSKAGGDAIRAMRADGKRRVRGRKRMKAEYLASKGLPLSFPRRNADIDAMVWTMRVTGKQVPLGKYPARQTKKGVSVLVNKGQRKLIKGAFIAKMKSGHVGVFVREGKARLPIQHALSTRVSDVFQDRGMSPAVLARGQGVFSSSFSRLMPMELEKARG